MGDPTTSSSGDRDASLIAGSSLSWTALANTSLEAWSLFAGIDMEISDDVAEVPKEGALYTTCCMINGAWNGGLVIIAPALMVQTAASNMLECAIDELTDADLLDAFGELANVIAGNALALFNSASGLALPVVAEGNDYTVHIPKGQILGQVNLIHDGQTTVTMLVEGPGV